MNSSQFSFSCVLFDLDGTLADTLPDINAALNFILRLEKQPEISSENLRNVVSHGTTAMIKYAFGTDQSPQSIDKLRIRLLEYYAENLCLDTSLFAGMLSVLNELQSSKISCGIVTNKPESLTYPLLQQLNIDQYFCSVICGDTLTTKKPSPEPLYTAASECGALATECIYVGDSQNDILAANRAGMTSLLASYGYIGESDRPEQWQANGIIQLPEEILDWLDYKPVITNYEGKQCH